MNGRRTVNEEFVLTRSPKTPCLNPNGIINYSCDSDELHIQSSMELEDDPLITFQNQSTGSDGYRTDIHCHESKPIYSNARARRKLVIASIVCFLFVIAEVVGGLLAGSLAVMTDAAHMLSDFAAFLISLFAIWVAHWLPDKKRTFGYYRAEWLASPGGTKFLKLIDEMSKEELNVCLTCFSLSPQKKDGTYYISSSVKFIKEPPLIISFTCPRTTNLKDTEFLRFSKMKEVLGALTSVLIIWVLTGVLVYLAVLRVKTHNFEIKADIMLITAGIGLAVNIILGIILHQTGMGHHHSHGSGEEHSHNHNSDRNDNCVSRRISRSNSLHNSSEKQNINVRAAFIHVLGDILQSVGVLIAAYIIKFKPEWKIADPICTFVFSLLVLFTTLNILRETIHVLMEGTPKNIKYNNVKLALESIEGVVAAHSLHIWSLTMSKAALSVHLAIEPGHDSQKVLNIATQKLKNQFQIYHSTIQVELYQESVMRSCIDCQDLQD